MDFYSVDALQYRGLEDERLPYAVNHSRREATQGYILAVQDGKARRLPHNYELESQLMKYFVEPLHQPTDCSEINLTPYSLVVFSPSDVRDDLYLFARSEFINHGPDSMLKVVHSDSEECSTKLNLKFPSATLTLP